MELFTKWQSEYKTGMYTGWQSVYETVLMMILVSIHPWNFKVTV
jgi:hypothetical protein